MFKDTLTTVRYLTVQDSYSIDTDNRPLTDLAARDNAIADELDSRTGLLVASSAGIVQNVDGCLASSTCNHISTGVYSITLTAAATTYGVTISPESTVPVHATYSNKTVNTFKVNLFDASGVAVDAPFTVRVAL